MVQDCFYRGSGVIKIKFDASHVGFKFKEFNKGAGDTAGEGPAMGSWVRIDCGVDALSVVIWSDAIVSLRGRLG